MMRNHTTSSGHIEALEAFSAATLNASTPDAEITDRLADAVREHITNGEWLHGRALSRVGISEVSPAASPVAPGHRPLFEIALGSGGAWDW